MPLETTEVLLRLGLATLLGALLGINREVNDKPAGLRTLALVALGSSFAPLLILSATEPSSDAVSRVLQGVLTGVGFLGAGVIMHLESVRTIRGLTTASVVWVVAGLGLASGLGLYREAIIGAVLALIVLVGGAVIEQRLLPRNNNQSGEGAERSPPEQGAS